MAKVKVYYDKAGRTPTKEYICEETGEEVILVKIRKEEALDLNALTLF